MSAHCPVCHEPAKSEHAPFCSQRCKDVDLGRWLKGVYVIPGPDSGEPENLPADDSSAGQNTDFEGPGAVPSAKP